jgi:hypothetical protein
VIVIMLSKVLSIDAVANTTDGLCVRGNGLLVKAGGRVRDRPSGPWEGPARGAECPTSDGAARAGGGACGPVGRSFTGCSRFFLFAGPPAQAVAFEFDTMCIVNDAVQNRVAKSRIGNYVMPLGHRHLTCDQQ